MYYVKTSEGCSSNFSQYPCVPVLVSMLLGQNLRVGAGGGGLGGTAFLFILFLITFF